MLKGHNLFWYARFSLIAAILYTPSVIFYLSSQKFTDSWTLYVGNVLFGITVAVFLFVFNRTRGNGASSAKMSLAGHLTGIMGIIMACVICLILLVIITPGVFGNSSGDALQEAPAQLNYKQHGLVSVLFLDATVGNFATASFVSILFPFTITKNQEGQAEPGNGVV
jgi:hypothetical protein